MVLNQLILCGPDLSGEPVQGAGLFLARRFEGRQSTRGRVPAAGSEGGGALW